MILRSHTQQTGCFALALAFVLAKVVVTKRRSKLVDASALMHVLDHPQAAVPSG